jgi:drug/metabolite transporter (DMT)-like permease
VTSEGSWTVFASFTGLGCLATLPAVLPPFGGWVTPLASDWALLLLVGAISVVGQFMLTDAMEHATAAKAGVIHSLTPVISLVCGVLFFQETFTAWTVCGAILTLGGVVGTVLSSAEMIPRRR